jgi:hypothetical protein
MECYIISTVSANYVEIKTINSLDCLSCLIFSELYEMQHCWNKCISISRFVITFIKWQNIKQKGLCFFFKQRHMHNFITTQVSCWQLQLLHSSRLSWWSTVEWIIQYVFGTASGEHNLISHGNTVWKGLTQKTPFVQSLIPYTSKLRFVYHTETNAQIHTKWSDCKKIHATGTREA